jgi:hypothetical protein
MILDQLNVAGVEFELEHLVAFGGDDELVSASCSGCKGCSAVIE